MRTDISKSARAIGTILKFISIALVFVFLYLGNSSGWDSALLSGIIISAVVAILSIFYLNLKFEKREISKPTRRVGVLVNYGALVILLALFYIANINGITIWLALGGVATFLAIIISFILVHMRTKLWKFTHTNIDDLDERQVYITHESLRNSYGIFSVVCLSLILAAELIREWSAGSLDLPFLPIFAALIYLAHTLPSSIIAWRESEV